MWQDLRTGLEAGLVDVVKANLAEKQALACSPLEWEGGQATAMPLAIETFPGLELEKGGAAAMPSAHEPPPGLELGVGQTTALPLSIELSLGLELEEGRAATMHLAHEPPPGLGLEEGQATAMPLAREPPAGPDETSVHLCCDAATPLSNAGERAMAEHRITERAALACSVRSFAVGRCTSAWQRLQQEFDVQQLVWSSTPVVGKGGKLELVSDPSAWPNADLRSKIAYALQTWSSERNAAAKVLAVALEGNVDVLNKATLAAARRVIEAEEISVQCDKLAGHFQGEWQEGQGQAHDSDFDDFLQACNLDDHSLMERARRALGLPVVARAAEREPPAQKARPPKSAAAAPSAARRGRSPRARTVGKLTRRCGRPPRSRSACTGSSGLTVSSLGSIREGDMFRL